MQTTLDNQVFYFIVKHIYGLGAISEICLLDLFIKLFLPNKIKFNYDIIILGI